MKHEWKIGEYYKEGFFYVKDASSWEKGVRWGFDRCVIADLVYDTCRKIIETDDKSPWAHLALFNCRELLFEGKRWPDYLEDNVPNHWKRNLPILKRFYFKNVKWYRSQYSVTRDPYILLYACVVHLGVDLGSCPNIPWYLYSPKTWAWIRALKGKRNSYLFWSKRTSSDKQFVIDLNKLMTDSYENK